MKVHAERNNLVKNVPFKNYVYCLIVNKLLKSVNMQFITSLTWMLIQRTHMKKLSFRLMSDSVIEFWGKLKPNVTTLFLVIYHICHLGSLMYSYDYESYGRQECCDGCRKTAYQEPSCSLIASWTKLMFYTFWK